MDDFNTALANLTAGATDAARQALLLFDGGIQIYGGLAERVNAIKQINAEIGTANQPAATTSAADSAQATWNSLKKFATSESGFLVAGALAVLGIGLIFSRGK